jgi:ABC-2 type transport system ATP-binding protein
VEVLGERLPGGGQRVRARSGVVLEQHGLYEGLSIRRTLEFAAGTYGLGRRAAAERVERVVTRLGLADRLDERPSALSRGMRQRMAVARGLLSEPDLLVLDEPTNGLDAEASAGLRAEIRELVGGGTTVFYTTHLLGEAERLCDQVAIVKRGRVIAGGSPAELRLRAPVTRVRLEGPGLAARLDGTLRGRAHEVLAPDAVRVTVDGLDDVPAVLGSLAAGGVSLYRVEPEGQTLEAAFLGLVS